MRVRNYQEVRQLYEKEKKKYAKEAHILTIQECPAEDFLLTSEERLEKYGFGEHTTVVLETDIIDSSVAATSEDNNTAGRAVPVKGANGFRTAVFLRERFDNCPSELIHWVIKLGVLYHEVGHAWEQKVGPHTNLELGTSNLQGAEEYADEFAKQRLLRVACRFDSTTGTLTNLWECFDLFRHKGTYEAAPADAEQGDEPPAAGVKPSA